MLSDSVIRTVAARLSDGAVGVVPAEHLTGDKNYAIADYKTGKHTCGTS